MKKVISLLMACIMLLSFIPLSQGAEKTLALAAGGETDYRIVVAAAASDAETTAAAKLKTYLEEITGADFAIVTDDAAVGEKEISVGDTNRIDGLWSADEDVDADAVRIFTREEKLFLTGGSGRGTLYAVATFLEDWLGCRWFTHDLTVTPHQDTLSIPAIDYFYEPSFRLRQTYWLFSTMYPEYCVAHKLQGVMAGLPESLGGGRYELAVSGVHTMSQFVTPAMFAEHPEYFGCDENGARQQNRQPCLRNDDVFRLAVDWAKAYFSNYNAILSLSQNDCMDFCRCEKCRAFNDAHGGADSAALLDFVNRVIREVRQTYPDARIETLAYQNSQTPPTGLQAEENVVIRFCGISTCTLHALDDPICTSNKKFHQDLTGWEKLCKEIYIWDYSTNFQYYYALFPNITALQARYQYYRDHHVVSIFDHGCGESIVPGEFHELRTYLVMKLLWNPDTDIERHMREFCEAYYGEAGADVVEFIRYFEKNVGGWNAKAVKVCHNSCQDGGVSLLNNSALSALNVRKLDALMEQAQARPLSEAQAQRLQGLSLSWRFFKNATFAGEFNWYSGFTDPEAETAKLAEDMRAYGVTGMSENGALWLSDEAPDGRMMPTFWYADEETLSPDILQEMRLRVGIHKVLSFVCTPLRLLFERFAALCG